MERLWVGVLVLALLLPELALLGFFTAGAVLALPAGLPHRADVVVVLGGDGGGERYKRGSELLRQDFARQLVLIEPSAAEREDALKNVPGVVIWDDVKPRNTWGEAQTTHSRMRANGWHTVLVVSDPPHMLRVRYAWGAAFGRSELSYTLVATKPSWWATWRWWTNQYAAQFVEDEVLKLGYYVFKYRFGLW